MVTPFPLPPPQRIKHSPPREVLYSDRAFSEPRFVGRARSSSYEFEPFPRPSSLEEGDVRILPLHYKHPYRLPVEDEVIPPHESSIWPKGVKHFNLVSSYDLMCGFLGLLPPAWYGH